MKCAIPVNGEKMSPHFGHCECFKIYDIDEKSKIITGTNRITSPEHQPGLLPGWLAEKGISVVIAGGMGARAQEIFKQNGIEVVLGALEDNPELAVLNYLNDNLNTGKNICDHL